MAAGAGRSDPRRRRVLARAADARRRRAPPDAGPRRPGWTRARRCSCRSCAATERVGLLVVGFDAPPAGIERRRRRGEAADVFMTALELFSLRQGAELQRDVRALLEEFSDSLSATLSLAAGLDIFCHGANRLFGADRTSVWIHERRARHLVLQASSDPAGVARGIRVGTDDASAPAAMAMRQHPRRDRLAVRRRLHRAADRSAARHAAARSARSSSKACASRRAASSTCSIAPTSSGASSRAPSRTCSCSTTSCGRGGSWRTRSIRSRTWWRSSDTRGHIVHVNQAFATRVGQQARGAAEPAARRPPRPGARRVARAAQGARRRPARRANRR